MKRRFRKITLIQQLPGTKTREYAQISKTEIFVQNCKSNCTSNIISVIIKLERYKNLI